MDYVSVRGLSVPAIIGVHDWERDITQTLIFNVDMVPSTGDVRRAAETDDLAEALDYSEVAQTISAVVRDGRFQLIETAAERVAEQLLADHRMRWLRLEVHKPVAGGGYTAAVTIERGQRLASAAPLPAAGYAGGVAERAGLNGPATGTADVWWARRRDAPARLAGLLDEAEQRRWAAYRREEDRQRFLVGCALAKTVLAGYTSQHPDAIRFDRTCPRCGQPHGKPRVKGSEFEHSVAHSGDLIVVAVARAPVGVDVEQLDGRSRPLEAHGDPEALARLVFSASEQAALATTDPADRARQFLVAWTRKEAVTKATGDGLRAAFSDVVVAADAGPPRLISWPYPQDPQSVSLLDLEADVGYVAALAVIGRCRAVRVRDGSALLARSAQP
jgi:4'-phosphopantetheinyl transferase